MSDQQPVRHKDGPVVFLPGKDKKEERIKAGAKARAKERAE